MDRCRLVRSFASLLLAVFLLPSAASAAGPTARVAGKLVSLSTAARTLTIEAADGHRVVLQVNASSRLLRNGSPVRLAGLALRDSVSAQFERKTLRVMNLRARGPAVDTTRGGVLAIDPALRRLSVGTPAGPRDFQLTPATLFVRNGRPATADDLTLRDALLVHSRASASGIPVAADIEADGPEEEEVEGTISAIAGSDVTVTPKQGKAVTVHVGDSTIIRIHLPHGEKIEGTLADLTVGMKAEAEFDPVSFDAFKIDAEQEDDDSEEEAHVKGKVTAVDPGAATITIEPKGGSPVTLAVEDSTRIKLNGDPAVLDDLPVGAKAEAEYDPATNLALKIEAETEDDDDDDDDHETAEVEGNVTAVSASSITIAPEGRRTPVTLTIDDSTAIVVDDEPGSAAAIKVGDEAEAKYDRETNVALRIKVENEDDEEDD